MWIPESLSLELGFEISNRQRDYGFQSPGFRLSHENFSWIPKSGLPDPGRIIIRFWETAHIPLPYATLNTYFSLRAQW